MLLVNRGQWAIINECRESADALIKIEDSSFQKDRRRVDALCERHVGSLLPEEETAVTSAPELRTRNSKQAQRGKAEEQCIWI
jgi:hypothetical protein